MIVQQKTQFFEKPRGRLIRKTIFCNHLIRYQVIKYKSSTNIELGTPYNPHPFNQKGEIAGEKGGRTGRSKRSSNKYQTY
jgi:hypothetical protein